MNNLDPKSTLNDDNALLAAFDGLVLEKETGKWCRQKTNFPYGCWSWRCTPDELEYHKNYEWLMPIWFKFRNIDFPESLDKSIEHTRIRNKIAYRITNDSIYAAHRHLVDGIKWYNKNMSDKHKIAP